MAPHRQDDVDGADFTGKRSRKWKGVTAGVVTAVATAVGAYFAGVDKGVGGADGDRVTREVVQNLVVLKSSLDDLNTTLRIFAEDRDANLEVARETRAEVGRLARRVSVEENAVDRHSEIMGKLDDFEKKGVKRR